MLRVAGDRTTIRLGWVLVATLASCHRSVEQQVVPEPAPSRDDAARAVDAELRCEPLPFAEETPTPEASGAAWLDVDGTRALVVISDSGNRGAYGVIDPDTGKTLEQGALPFDGPDQDFEGIASRDGVLYAVTSPGWITSWRRDPAAHAFARVDGPYPLGPHDLPDVRGKIGDPAPTTDGMVCGVDVVNCGRNYEGICLAPPAAHPSDHLVGFVLAKADGNLYALSLAAGRLAIDRSRAIHIGRSGTIADCAYASDGTLFAGGNSFDLGGVYRVDGWQDPATAQVARVASLLVGFPETLAVDGDTVYRMSDMGGAPSKLAKFHCSGLRSIRAVPVLPR